MRVLAAGSLRRVWKSLVSEYQADNIQCNFGPAGILRERIEAGEACDFCISQYDSPTDINVRRTSIVY